MTVNSGGGGATERPWGLNRGGPTALDADLSVPLPGLAVIELSGADALSFLSAQFTSDLHSLAQETSQISSWCTPQGRVLTVFRIYRYETSISLILPAEAVAQTLGRLQRYVLRSRVEIENGTGRTALLGLSGPSALDRVMAVLGTAPEQIDEVVHAGTITAVRLPGRVSRCLILGSTDAIRAFQEHLPNNVMRGDPGSWTLLDVLAGIPVIVPTISEHFLPQMLNLDALGGLSFTKGCYPGQEVIARLRYRGSLKRRMHLASVLTSTVPEPGVRLFLGGSEPPTAVGEVVSAAAHPDGSIAVLAVVEIEAARSDAVHLHNVAGPILRFQPLPYPVPEN